MNIVEAARRLATHQQYKLSAANTILNPGKFEGEHVLTVYFYDQFLNGFHDGESEDGSLLFELSSDDKKFLNEKHKYYGIYIDDSGFCDGDFRDE